MGYDDEWRTTRYTYDGRGRVVDTIQYDDRARPGDPHPLRLRRGRQQDRPVYRYARGQHRRRGGHLLHLRPLRQAADDDRPDGADRDERLRRHRPAHLQDRPQRQYHRLHLRRRGPRAERDGHGGRRGVERHPRLHPHRAEEAGRQRHADRLLRVRRDGPGW